MQRTVWTYGLIAGAILVVMMVLTFTFGRSIDFDTGAVIGYASMVAAFLLVFFGVRSYRDDVAGGTVGFGRALAVGTLIVVVASVCYVAAWQVIYFKVAPDFLDKYQAHEIAKARAGGATEAQIAQKQAENARLAQQYQNPLFNAAITFVEPLPVGLVFALATAGILSRRRRAEVPGEIGA